MSTREGASSPGVASFPEGDRKENQKTEGSKDQWLVKGALVSIKFGLESNWRSRDFLNFRDFHFLIFRDFRDFGKISFP